MTFLLFRKSGWLSPGLMIREINGISVTGKTVQECLEMMAGPAGTKVRLQLSEPNHTETKTIELTRQKFLMPS
jgi:C-terminal processing protease CtpA/Prc